MERYHILQMLMLIPACLIYMLPLQRPSGFWKNYLMVSLISALAMVSFAYYLISLSFSSLVQTMYWHLRPIFTLAVIVLIVKISVRLSWSETLYCSLWAYLTRELCYHFSWVVARFLAPDSWVPDLSFFINTLICHVLIYSGAYFFLARSLPLEGRLSQSRGEIRLAVLLAALVTVIKLLSVFTEDGSMEFNLSLLALVICAFFSMAVLYAQRAAEKRISLAQELALQKRLWLEHEKQMESVKRSTELLNAKYHDLKHYIAALRMPNQFEQGSRVLDELEESVQAFDSVVRTGNETLDAALMEKSLCCQRDRVILTCSADGTLLRGMEAVDLYVMLGNALDNAIECVTGLEDVQRRTISVAIFRVRDMVKIQIENPYDREPVFENDLPVTTKADKESHGFGMKSIKTVAERYGGYVTTTAEDGMFTLHILFPLEMLAEVRYQAP